MLTGRSRSIAYIVETSTSPTASGVTAEAPLLVSIPRGAAIRDMAAVQGGLLLLLGPDDDDSKVDWSISLLQVIGVVDRRLTVETIDLGKLELSDIPLSSCDKEIRPEGMAVLSDSVAAAAGTYRLAIFSDGMCDGGPIIIDARLPYR